jgi:hypothetical protein
MAKRGISIAFALALAFVLAFGGTAMGQGELTRKQAKAIAKKLGHKQVKTQGVVAYHLGKPRRISATAIAFPYDARTKSNTFCRATLRVRRSGSQITASIGKQRCIAMPSDALAAEAATRKTLRSMLKTAKATRRSVRRLGLSLGNCRNLDVPKSRTAGATAVIDIATVNAVELPNDGPLGRFVGRLGNIDTNRRVLGTGIAAWTDYVAVLRSLPVISDPCKTLRRWAKADWAANARPVDVAAWHQLDRRSAADERAIVKAAAYLARVGVFPAAVVAFTPQGLLLRYLPQD